jgi:gliding motility-associated-like protein
VNILGNTNICAGNNATLTATGGVSYSWNTGETTAIIYPSIPGSYTVIATVGSCTATAVANVVVNPNPVVQAFPNMVILQGESATLTASGAVSYIWNNGMNGASIMVSPAITTVYCVTGYDLNGCHDTACVTVTVEHCSNAGTLYLPNAFSPNGDGENDSLQIYYGIMQCIKKFRLVIYNRWGEKIYETTNPNFRWDGIYNSGILQNTQYGNTQVFTFYMEADIADGTSVKKKGNISIVR